MADIFSSNDVLEWKFAQNQSARSFSLGELVNLTEDTRGDDNFLQASTQMLRSALNFNDDTTSSTTVAYSTVKYARVPISDIVVFGSITLEIAYPSDLDILATNYLCSRNGCWDKLQLNTSTREFKQDVRAYGQCLDKDGTEETRFYRDDLISVVNNSCVAMANSSIRIFGGGKRIAGDTWEFMPPNGTTTPGLVHMSNVREIYSVAMGGLSWQVQDLSATDPAPGPQVHTNIDLMGWRFLDLPSPSGGASIHHDSSSSPNVNSDADKVKLLTGIECSKENEIVIDRVLKNHLYIEDSHQTACIAAFHFLFQNAIARQQIEIGDNVGLEPRLRFSGNDYQMAVRASIPTASMVLSVLGCAVLLAIGAASVCYRNRSTSRIAELTEPRTVAEAMVNDTKFPSWLLHLTLKREQSIVPLEQLQIRSVELVHETAEADAADDLSEVSV